MRRSSPWLIGALLMGLLLSGCSALPPLLVPDDAPATPAPSGEAAAEGAGADPETENAPTTSPEQQFFDNLALLKAQLTGFDPEGDRRLENYPSTSWDETGEAGRAAVVDIGKQACEQPIPASASEDGDRQMLWLSARFLCPDRLPEAERAFEAFGGSPGGAQLLEIYELSVLRGDRTADDVLTALTLCVAEVEIAWVLPDGFSAPQTLCWMIRVNALDARGRESDFVALFEEGGDSAVSFDALAKDLGARPNALAEDAG